MKRLAAVLLLAAACNKAEPLAVTRLGQYLVDSKREVASEQLGSDTLWTDKAILERTDDVPKGVKDQLDKATLKLSPGAMGAMLQDLERRRAEWQPAEVKRKGAGDFDCEIRAGEIAAAVNGVYVSYLEARYPKGRFQAKGAFEPLLFLEGETLRAVLMPVKP